MRLTARSDKHPAMAWVLYPLEDALLVLNPAQGHLAVVQGLDSWLLLGQQQGLNVAQLYDEYTRAFPAALLTRETLETRLGQLQTALAAPSVAATDTYRQEYQAVLARPAEPARAGEGIGLTIDGFRVQIVSPHHPGVLPEWRRVCPQQMLSGSFQPHVRFDIRRTGYDRYDVSGNGLPLRTAVAEAAVMPLLMDLIQIMHYQRSDYLLAVHAAVVVQQGSALILPGVSGAGKSTLCAHLAAEGFAVYSDELAVLRAPDAIVQPLPLPVAVKSGSWALLQARYPVLAAAPVWERADGRRLKYLPLPVPDQLSATADTLAAPLLGISRQVVVFPRYDSACEQPTLQAITPLELLAGLTQAGYQLPHAPDNTLVERLLAFAQGTPAYRLHYADLAAAQHLLTPLLDVPLTPNSLS